MLKFKVFGIRYQYDKKTYTKCKTVNVICKIAVVICYVYKLKIVLTLLKSENKLKCA